MQLKRPVLAQALFESPEMALRYPGEIELRRDGSNEGDGRGFDNMDPSAEAWRTIASADSATLVAAWFEHQLLALGWAAKGRGWFGRAEIESFRVRVDRDHGVSRVASTITDPKNQRIQDEFERWWYAGAPAGWSVLTLSYLVAADVVARGS